ncbi:MAG: hypothetical protein K9G48_10015 [Reyranella sp.]|nr:hypothetical protein [Reyranella sp.]
MSDERQAREPMPYLRTRLATMLTAIGLCAAIIAMHLVPEPRDVGGIPAPVTVVAGTR